MRRIVLGTATMSVALQWLEPATANLPLEPYLENSHLQEMAQEPEQIPVVPVQLQEFQQQLVQMWDDLPFQGAANLTSVSSRLGITRLELISLSNDWVTVSIEGINGDVEVSFTADQPVQTIYLETGVYRIRFRPTLTSEAWQSGYLNVGQTGLLQIAFDQNHNQVRVHDDPTAWAPDNYRLSP